MESLYRKYRPLTFESVVGQQHIVSTLEHAVAEGRLSHAYLFCGPRGTGKTTMARILAKALLCEKSDAARAEGAVGCMPDGTCPECEAIAAGTHPDVYELDAASRTGVDNVREEIINSVSFAPVRGAYKVYIIDEVHMLTTQAFNALLKTLEEPPSHVIFVLCTTDPQKILETILSRCQRFDFHRISNEDIVGRLRYICEQEGFTWDDEALEIVAKHARGGMRDALSTLEQLSVFGDGAVRIDDARALLGEVASTVLAEFACKMAVRDTVGLFSLVRTQVDEGNDLIELTRDLIAHIRDVYTAAIAGPKLELFDGTPEEVAALVEEARLFEDADRLARALTVLDDAALEMRDASDPRLVLEVALTRLARPQSDLTLEALAERIAHLETQLAAGVPSGPMGAEQLASVTGARTGGPAAGARGAMPTRAGRAEVAPARMAPQGTVPLAASEGSRAVEAQPAGVSRASGRPVVEPAPVGRSAGAQATEARAAVQASPRSSGVQAAEGPSRAVRSAAQGAAPVGASPAAPASVSAATPAASATASVVPLASSSAPSSAPVADSASPARAQSAAVEATVSAESQPSMASCAATPPASDDGDLQRRWSDAVKRITAEQPSRGGLLQSSRALSDDGETLTIGFPKGSNFALKMITRPDSNQLVMPIICRVFGKRSVKYVMDGAPAGTSTASASNPAVGARRAPAPQTAPVNTMPRSAQATRPTPPVSSVPTGQGAPSAPAGRTVSAVSAVPDGRVPSNSAPAGQAEPVSQVTPAGQAAPAERVVPAGQLASAADQATGPTVLSERDIEADRKAWEDDMPPYDDAFIASYEDDEEIPPFDVPVRASNQAPAAVVRHESAQPLGASASVVPESPSMSAPAPVSSASPEPVSSAVAAAGPSDGSPSAPDPGDSADDDASLDPKAVLESIWGNVTFKPAE